jgi:hypothetical protein
MANWLWQWLVTMFRLLWEALRYLIPILRALIRDLLERLRCWWQERGLSERRRARRPCVPINRPACKTS